MVLHHNFFLEKQTLLLLFILTLWNKKTAGFCVPAVHDFK
jgi:hypothetical protein